MKCFLFLLSLTFLAAQFPETGAYPEKKESKQPWNEFTEILKKLLMNMLKKEGSGSNSSEKGKGSKTQTSPLTDDSNSAKDSTGELSMTSIGPPASFRQGEERIVSNVHGLSGAGKRGDVTVSNDNSGRKVISSRNGGGGSSDNGPAGKGLNGNRGADTDSSGKGGGAGTGSSVNGGGAGTGSSDNGPAGKGLNGNRGADTDSSGKGGGADTDSSGKGGGAGTGSSGNGGAGTGSGDDAGKEREGSGTLTHVVGVQNLNEKVKAAGSNLVVIAYTMSSNSPYKEILPKIKEMAANMRDVIFLEVDVDESSLNNKYPPSKIPSFEFMKDNARQYGFSGANLNFLNYYITRFRK